MRAFLFLFCALAAAHTAAESTLSGELPRVGGKPLEAINGLDSHYGVLEIRNGPRLRTVLTRPSGSRGPLPAILFVQWLSCDSIELPASQTDGWSRMLRHIARDSGAVMMRTEKAGVGDSEGGPCAGLDYETELRHHREALAALRQSGQADPERIVVFGASMGGNMAPLVAQGQEVAGVMIWGGGAHTWFERMLGFERRAKELEGLPAGELDSYVKQVTRFFHGYLLDGRTPEAIVRDAPELEGVWARIVGTGEGTHYGRPLAFHWQAQARNWPAAWAAVKAPVLAVYGEYDWFESADAHRLVADLVNAGEPGRGRFVVIPKTDHHFVRYPDRLAAYREEGGTVNADAAADEMLHWLREVMR
jgi:pimeloyl-ACP methyl ester carboxylesterase